MAMRGSTVVTVFFSTFRLAASCSISDAITGSRGGRVAADVDTGDKGMRNTEKGRREKDEETVKREGRGVREW